MLLVALSVAFRHATETHLEFEVANKDEEKKRSWLFTERGLGFQTAGSGTRTRDFRVSSTALWPLDHAAQVLICVATRRHTYCSSTNQCLQTLTTEQKKKIRILRLVAFQARVKSLFKTYLEQCCLWSVVRWTSLHHIWQSPPPLPQYYMTALGQNATSSIVLCISPCSMYPIQILSSKTMWKNNYPLCRPS